MLKTKGQWLWLAWFPNSGQCNQMLTCGAGMVDPTAFIEFNQVEFLNNIYT
jgi:hypothetical protein